MPTRSTRQNRLSRTIVLGAVGVFAAIAWLARELDMDRDVLLDYATTGLLLVGSLVLLALLAAALLHGLKWLLRRRG